jgi:large subunit ribosomal protein L23
MTESHQIIKRIRLSEKAALGKEKNNEFVFEVERKANKIQVRQAVERLFGVKVVSVNTANFDGKARRARTARAGRTNHWKKAVVKLKEGDTIDLV